MPFLCRFSADVQRVFLAPALRLTSHGRPQHAYKAVLEHENILFIYIYIYISFSVFFTRICVQKNRVFSLSLTLSSPYLSCSLIYFLPIFLAFLYFISLHEERYDIINLHLVTPRMSFKRHVNYCHQSVLDDWYQYYRRYNYIALYSHRLISIHCLRRM